MSEHTELKSIVGELYNAPPATIDAGFSLRHPRLKGSAGRGVLVAAIRRRLGIYAPRAFKATTYGELEAAVYGSNGNGAADSHGVSGSNGSAAAATTAPAPAIAAEPSVAPGSLAIGVDLEMVDQLPDAADYWTSEFYRTHFSSAEIAYCMQQEQPRMHFAARWSAKEALAKCDARFKDVEPSSVQVALDAGGRPRLEWVRDGKPERLPHAVSLTHTPLLAAAVVAMSAQSVDSDRKG